MKNSLTLVSVPILAFFLIGCGSGGTSVSQPTTNSTLETNNTQDNHNQTSELNGVASQDTLNSSTDTTDTTISMSSPVPIDKVAKSSSGRPVKYDFEGYTLQIISSKTLNENDEVAHESVVIYGTVNGKSTDALLKVNENYRNSKLTLQVFKENRLLLQKDGIEFTNQVAVNFGDITVE